MWRGRVLWGDSTHELQEIELTKLMSRKCGSQNLKCSPQNLKCKPDFGQVQAAFLFLQAAFLP